MTNADVVKLSIVPEAEFRPAFDGDPDECGAELDIVIDIRARKPSGFSEGEIRTIRENARTLKFDDSGFAAD